MLLQNSLLAFQQNWWIYGAISISLFRKASQKLVSFLIFQPSILLLTDEVTKTGAPLLLTDTCGFVYIIVLIEKSARKINNTSQTENLRVFFSTKCVIKDTIWFSITNISERIEIEKWRAPLIFGIKKCWKFLYI